MSLFENIIKGDKPGHEFHGNQYGTGLSVEEQATANAKLDSLPAWHGFTDGGSKGGDVSSGDVFGNQAVSGAFGIPKENSTLWTKTQIDLSKLTPGQPHIPREGLKAYIKELPTKNADGKAYLPQVVHVQGKYVIVSGHTRLGAQVLAGRTTAPVKLVEYDGKGYVKPTNVQKSLWAGVL